MTLNVSEFQKRITIDFPDAKPVNGSIIRFTKMSGDQPFAVCYIDLTDKLPQTLKKLSEYQDQIIGTHYFEGNKSLQWNNYLYFITSKDYLKNKKVRHLKELIEGDRSYARKFVITKADIELVLKPPVAISKDITPRVNILSIWTKHLTEVNLNEAIFKDYSIPKRLKLIEYSTKKAAPKATTQIPEKKAKALPFIQALKLSKFRNFPLKKNFNFGTVNLIYGINGSGKTSLFEAIELFYCGFNKRNPKLKLPYELVVAFADGSHTKATNKRRLKIFRDRNLIWYGQPEVKTNNLYQSFARFNFLDTDAAVSLSESAEYINEDLSKLLVGPEASKTWQNILRVTEAVEGELRGIRPREKEAKEELTVLKKRIKELKTVRSKSDLIFTRLKKMVQKLRWGDIEGDKEDYAIFFIEELSELEAIVKQATDLEWIKTPVSFKAISDYCHKAIAAIKKTDKNISKFENLLKTQTESSEALKQKNEALELTEQAKLLIESGISKIALDLEKQGNIVENYSRLIAGFNDNFLDILTSKSIKWKIDKYYKTSISNSLKAEALLKTAKNEYEKFSKIRENSINLAQELRQIATRILEDSSKPDECPLCHTQFKPGELKKHIHADVDEQLESLGQELLSDLRNQEIAVRDSLAVEDALRWLKDFKENAKLTSGISVRSAVNKVIKMRRDINKAQHRIKTLNNKISILESKGQSLSKLKEISGSLKEIGCSHSKLNAEVINKFVTALKNDSKQLSETLNNSRKQAIILQKRIKSHLNSEASDIKDIKNDFSKLLEKHATTESIKESLTEFLTSFPWPRVKPLAKLMVEAGSVRNVAMDLKVYLDKEEQADFTLTEFSERQEMIEERVKNIKLRIKRFKEAQSTLKMLQRDHSLQNAMELALQQNRHSIEMIFSNIHSPADFKALGSSWTSLIRVSDGSEASLSEISTGQRAAFALSIFLAQNSQLKKEAPPVILIDDPIAHVDDLNSLSFLDYLREVVLAGGKQVFFSTANSKLATLFEKKFDFLGEKEFCRINLNRERVIL